MKRKDPAAIKLGRKDPPNVELDDHIDGQRVIRSLRLPKEMKLAINGKVAKVGDSIRVGDSLTLIPPKETRLTYQINLAWAASALGRKGGRKSSANMTPEQREARARKAAAARWKKEKA